MITEDKLNTEKKSLISILGGGDTISAINKNKNKLTFTKRN